MEQKRGEGKQRFLKGGKLGQEVGALKRGGWNPMCDEGREVPLCYFTKQENFFDKVLCNFLTMKYTVGFFLACSDVKWI